jgi:DNA-binding CsgD family transcriptional regulator/tetratricopeptide (TPR) repeat protein
MARAPTIDGGKRTLKRRRIIERPRLIALLDQSTARVRTLIAPAGYGKTTLAEQWVAKEGRRGTWFTARRSSTDVAALALGLARAAAEIVPDCDARLREHLRALPAPAENVEVLAELLGEDLTDWPDDAWLVLDDYQELTPTEEAEQFVEALVAESPIQLVIASRQRPCWITARTVLYGEALELNQTELAMDGREASEVLSGRDAASASELASLAKGWPAVIGLAGVSTAEVDTLAVPESLYRFFAEEVFSQLERDVQAGIAMLAIAPLMDRTIAVSVLGEDADRICEAALDVGILVERGRQLEIHPLARAFIEEYIDQLAIGPDEDTVQRCLSQFCERRDWDTAFDLVVRWDLSHELELLLEQSLDELLETGRLSTIESWCDHAERLLPGRPIISLSQAEVALRRGRFAVAQSYAEAVTSGSPALQSRGLSLGGRAAHLSSHEEEALELYRRAEKIAPTDALRREAVWGQASCLADLELPEAVTVFESLATGVGPAAPREKVRAATMQLYLQSRFGAVDLAEADRAVEVAGAVSDPLVVSSFLSVYSALLALTARYDEAVRVAQELLRIAYEYRLDFACTYAHCPAGTGHAGMRRWDEAERSFVDGIAAARAGSNAQGEQACLAAQIRTLAQQGRFDEALRLAENGPTLDAPVPLQVHAELVATRALVLAATGKVKEAQRTVDLIRGVSQSVDATVLIDAVDAIVRVKCHDSNAIERASMFATRAMATGGIDHLVTTYRAVPEILAMLLRSPMSIELLVLIGRAGDEDLASVLGPSASKTGLTALTAREREVHQLVGQGLTNREIAALLFITEATAKRHVQHILKKLGVQSRKVIAMQAILTRAPQATSAIDDTDVGTDS